MVLEIYIYTLYPHQEMCTCNLNIALARAFSQSSQKSISEVHSNVDSVCVFHEIKVQEVLNAVFIPVCPCGVYRWLDPPSSTTRWTPSPSYWARPPTFSGTVCASWSWSWWVGDEAMGPVPPCTSAGFRLEDEGRDPPSLLVPWWSGGIMPLGTFPCMGSCVNGVNQSQDSTDDDTFQTVTFYLKMAMLSGWFDNHINAIYFVILQVRL